MLIYLYKVVNYVTTKILLFFNYTYGYCILKLNNVKFKKYIFYGMPIINVSINGLCELGNNLTLVSRPINNPIGRYGKCSIVVRSGGKLTIGNNFGMSFSSIYCSLNITIGNDVKMGGNCVVYDTDFHSLNYFERQNQFTDLINAKSSPVEIGNDVFIGAGTTILKGVTIGDKSIVGAGSVVSKSIPSGQIWAGNPAKFIRDINYQ